MTRNGKADRAALPPVAVALAVAVAVAVAEPLLAGDVR